MTDHQAILKYATSALLKEAIQKTDCGTGGYKVKYYRNYRVPKTVLQTEFKFINDKSYLFCLTSP